MREPALYGLLTFHVQNLMPIFLSWITLSKIRPSPRLFVIYCKKLIFQGEELLAQKKNIRHLYRGINDFKRGYQLRSKLVKDENGDLLADSHVISNRRENYSQLLNVHGINDVRQIEIYTAGWLACDPSPSEFQLAIVKLEKYRTPGSDQFTTELVYAGSAALHSEIHELANSIWNKEELPDQWKESIIL
jgi:hypothetical protein